MHGRAVSEACDQAHGLLESAYEGALYIELRRQGIAFEQQRVYPLYYKGELAGAYVADLISHFDKVELIDANLEFPDLLGSAYEYLMFVRHMISALKRGGRMAVIMLHGVLFRGGEECRMHEWMIRHGYLKAIIGLPPALFLRYRYSCINSGY